MKPFRFLNSFILLSAFYLLVILFGSAIFAMYLKPSLMWPLLIAVYYSPWFANQKLLLAALFFSWIGDVVLLFAPLSQWYFIGGLLSFLTAHVLYLSIFYNEQKGKKVHHGLVTWGGLTVLLIFLAAILIILTPHLAALTVPVCIYATTICVMLGMALLGFSSWPTTARYWILSGAILFVFSDTILAFNKFYQPIGMASFLIMTTYLAAQYAITKGVLNLNFKFKTKLF